MLYNSYQSKYLLASSTPTSYNGQVNNAINIPYSHAYSVLSIFSITGDDRTVYNCAMIRNPWGTVSYNGSLNAKDPFWTANTIS